MLNGLALVPAALAFLFIHRFAVNAIYQDEWDLVPLIDRFYAGHLTLGAVFEQHNEHRIFFPELVMLGIGKITRFNTIPLMYVSAAFIGIGLTCIFLIHRSVLGTGIVETAYFVPVAWLAFTLRQSENLLWGFQLQITGCIATFLIAVYFLRDPEKSWWRVGLAAFSCTLSAFSFSAGLLSWPSLGCAFLYAWLTRRKSSSAPRLMRMGFVWTLMTVMCWATYFHGYRRPDEAAGPGFVLHHPLRALTIYIATWGGPMSGDFRCELIAGGAVLLVGALVGIAALRGEVVGERFLIALPMVVFGAAALAMITMGRGGISGEQLPGTSRYVSITVVGMLGVIYGVLSLRGGSLRSFLLVASAVLLLASVVSSLNGTFEYGGALFDQRRRIADTIRHYSSRSDAELVNAYPNPDVVRAGGRILERLRLNVFADGG